MSFQIIIVVLTGAVLTSGCSLNWDGPRPAAPADARLDGPAADAGPAADQATPDAETDMYWQDFSWSDALVPDTLPPDVGSSPDLLQTDAPPCGYRYCGKPSADASAGAVNALVGQGWQPTHFVHAADDHAAWLVDNKGKYEVARASTGKGLETLVKARLSVGQGSVKKLLANKEFAVWMESGSQVAYVGANSSSAVSASLQGLITKGWKVRTFANQPNLQFAVWLRKQDTFKLLERSFSTTFKKDLNTEHAAGWIPQGFLTRDGYAGYVGWAFDKVADTYDYCAYATAGGLNGWLQYKVVNWKAGVIQSTHLHAVWLTSAQYVLSADDGWNLAGQLYKHQQTAKTAKVERFFAKKDYVVWLYKSCAP